MEAFTAVLFLRILAFDSLFDFVHLIASAQQARAQGVIERPSTALTDQDKLTRFCCRVKRIRMNFFGKKGAKKPKGRPPPPEYTPFDFSTPDAFSEENMAKVGTQE